MGKVEGAFLVTYLLGYALSKCPLFESYSFTSYLLVIMFVMGIILLVDNLKHHAYEFEPRVDYKKSAILIAGADYPVGWQSALRLHLREARVFIGVEDPEAPASGWLIRHLPGSTMVRLRPANREDAEAAAAVVQQGLGDDTELLGVIYAGYNVPRLSESLDLTEVQRGIEMNAVGAVNIAQTFAPLLKKSNGRFVILGDLAGRIALPSLLSYCMTQGVVLQYADIIRKMLEPTVSVHLIEPFLFNFKKMKKDDMYPATSLEDGKVLLENKAEMADMHLHLITRSALHACLAVKPQERYLPTYEDYFLDKLISYCPSWISNRVVVHVFNKLKPKKE